MASGLTPWLATEIPDDPSLITPEMLAEWKKKQKLATIAAAGCNVLYEELGLRRRMNFYFEFKKSSEWKNLGFLKTVRMGKEILKKDVSKAFNEVKAASKAHDKQVSLNTNRNLYALQALKPWASSDDLAAARGRGFSRGRGFPSQGGGRPRNDFGPRNDFNSPGGSQFPTNQRGNFQQRGQFNSPPKFQQRGNQPQGQQRNNNSGSNLQGGGSNNHNRGNNFNNGGYQNKPRPPNNNFRGGGN